MVKLRNSFDGGTHGVVITPGNSGGVSGDAFTAVTPDALFSNVRARSGNLSMLLPAGAVAGYGRWAFPASKNVATRTWHWLSETIVGTDFDIIQIRVGGATNIATIRVSGYATPAGALRLRVGSTTAWTAGVVFPANEWVRVEVLIEQGAGANDGRARLACYSGDSLVAIADSGWLTGLALAGDGPGVDSVVLGKTNAGASPAASMDDAAANTGADYTGDFIALDIPPNRPPVANAGPNQTVLPGTTVTLPGGGTDPDDDSLTYQWDWVWPATGAPALTGATTATASFTAGAAGEIYAARLTVSDGTDTSTDTVNIAVVDSVGTVESNILAYDGTAWV